MGETVEADIDDMVIKIRRAQDHIRDAGEVFEVFQKFRMKLNPLKCAFGVSSRQFLGHVVSKHGIEPSSTQMRTLSKIQEPKTVRNVQSLAGKVSALSRFISKMSDKCKPFFRCIKQSSTLEWGEEQSKALRELKKYLSTAPILSAPAEEEDLYLYLAVSDVAVSGVLIREDGGKKSQYSTQARYSSMPKHAIVRWRRWC